MADDEKIQATPLLKPKEIEIEDEDGATKTYILSRFDSMKGYEISVKYPLSLLPKIGDYKTNEQMVLEILSHVAVPQENGRPLRLHSRALVNNHTNDTTVVMRLLWEMATYNFGFFLGGRTSNFFEEVAQKFLSRIAGMLTQSQPPLSPPDSPPTMN